MARVHNLEFSTEEEAAIAVIRLYLQFPPRAPVPEWWVQFQKWYADLRPIDFGKTKILLRTEAFGMEDI